MYYKDMASLDDEELDSFIKDCLPEGLVLPNYSRNKMHLFLRRYETTMNLKLSRIEKDSLRKAVTDENIL